MINIFKVFYDSGKTYRDCMSNGPDAIVEALAGCNADELETLARKQLGISAKDISGLNPSQLTTVIINRVVSVASRGMAFSDC